jgi:hypothetical protein
METQLPAEAERLPCSRPRRNLGLWALTIFAGFPVAVWLKGQVARYG